MKHYILGLFYAIHEFYIDKSLLWEIYVLNSDVFKIITLLVYLLTHTCYQRFSSMLRDFVHLFSYTCILLINETVINNGYFLNKYVIKNIIK